MKFSGSSTQAVISKTAVCILRLASQILVRRARLSEPLTLDHKKGRKKTPHLNHTPTKTGRLHFAAALVALIAVSVGTAVGFYARSHNASAISQEQKQQAQQKSKSCPTCSAPAPQSVYVPYFDLPGDSGSEVVLNSRSPHALDMTPILYTDEGVSVQGEPITLQPAEIRTVDVQSLIPAGQKDHKWSGLTFAFTGNPLEMWAQLRILGVGRAQRSVDALFSVGRDKRSDVAEAAWVEPLRSQTILGVGNYSDTPMDVSVQYADGEERKISVAPFATEFVRRRGDERRKGKAGTDADGVRLQQTSGKTGSLIATGAVISDDGSFTTSIRFVDTQNAVQQNLYATNFRLKNVTPYLALKNASGSAIMAQARFRPLAGEAANPVEIPALTIQPNDTALVDLRQLVSAVKSRGDLDTASVQVTSTGAPGSLVGAINGVDNATRMTYDVPLRDTGLMRNSTGAYPFFLGDDYTTVVSVTNTGDTKSEFILQLNYEGGPFIFNPRKLAPGETATIDIKKLRDEGQTDNKGRTLPKDITSGQARWSIHGAGSARLIGRSEVLSVSRRISSSYSCACDCPTAPTGVWIDPSAMTLLIGDTGSFAGWETSSDCVGNTIGPYSASGDWWVDNPNIGSMASGTVTAVGVGQTNVHMAVFYETYYWDGLNCYDNGRDEWDNDGGMTVLPTITAGNIVLNPTTISPAQGSTLSITLTASSGVTNTDNVTLQVGISGASQNFRLSFGEKPVQDVALSAGQSKTFTFPVKLEQPPSSTTTCKLIAIVSAPPSSIAVVNNNKESDTLTINTQ